MDDDLILRLVGDDDLPGALNTIADSTLAVADGLDRDITAADDFSSAGSAAAALANTVFAAVFRAAEATVTHVTLRQDTPDAGTT